MDQEDLNLFRTVCFLQLMQHGEGLSSKAPKYIREKMKTSEDLIGAWNMLDNDSQLKVLEWSRHWHFPLEKVIEAISERKVSL